MALRGTPCAVNIREFPARPRRDSDSGQVTLGTLAAAALVAAIALVALLAFRPFKHCEPSSGGITIGGMLVAGCRAGRHR